MSAAARWNRVHLASLVVVFVFVAYCARGQWFGGDEWDFLVHRGVVGSPARRLLDPHNEHWSTLPILAWRAIFSVVGVRSYWPYMTLLLVAHVLCVHFLWRILRRLPDMPPLLAIFAAAAFGLYGTGWENLLWAFQIGFIGSLAFGLGLVAALDDAGGSRRVAAVAVGAVLSLMVSGISVVMVGVVGLAALARWGWRKAAAVTLPAAVVYLVWLAAYGESSIEEQSAIHGGIGDIPRYVLGGLGAALGEPLGYRRLGYVLLALLVAVALWQGRRWWRTAPDAVAMAAGAVALFAVVAQGRGALPVPWLSRYLYLAAGLLFPLVTLAVASGARRWAWARAAAVAAAIALCASGAVELWSRAAPERRLDAEVRGQFFAALELADRGVALVSDTPQAPYVPDLTMAHLRSLRRWGKLPEPPRTTARDRARAQLALQVGAFARPPRTRALGGTRAASLVELARATDDGCVDIDTHGQNLQLDADGHSAFSVSARAGGVVNVFLTYSGGFAGPRYVTLRPGETQTIVSDVTGALVLQLPRGSNRLCGISWGR